MTPAPMSLWLAFAQNALAQGMPPNHPANPGMDWQIPAAVLVAGLVAAFLVLNRSRNTDASIEEQSRRLDLQGTRDEAIEALRQLELEREKMDPAEYEADRQSLLGRGARALAALEGKQGEPDSPTPAQTPAETPAAQTAPAPQAPAAPTSGLAPEWKGALYALGAVAMIGGFIWFAQQGANPRGENMGMTGGDVAMGGNPGAMPGNPASENPMDTPGFKSRVERFTTQLETQPDSMAALNGLTQLYFTHGDPATAMQYNDKALAVDPKDLDARTYRAVLTAMMSMIDRAIVMLDEVVTEAPDHAKAVTYRGLILLEAGRTDDAIASLEHAVALQPDNGVIAQALAQARTIAAGGGLPPQPASGDLIVSGTVSIDPAAAATLTGSEVVYISVKDPTRPGPPVAADRMAPTFPAPFSLTTADIRAMPGAQGGVPAVMELTIRVDVDGNAMTKEAAPLAVVTGVRNGTSGLNVVLTAAGTPTAAPASGGAPAAAAGGEVYASGTVTLGPGATYNGSDVVFISVKDPAGGPPLAVDRKVAASFPLAFEVTDANVIPMMAGRPVPAQILVSIRIDSDGNASTKDGEPAAELNTAKGSTGLNLTLQ